VIQLGIYEYLRTKPIRLCSERRHESSHASGGVPQNDRFFAPFLRGKIVISTEAERSQVYHKFV
jgi:hypothetical protein